MVDTTRTKASNRAVSVPLDIKRDSNHHDFQGGAPKPRVAPLDLWRRKGDGRMQYTNSEMKLDQLIGYFNERKINLIPPFQSGHVWKLNSR